LWGVAFFSVYLATSVVVVIGWYVMPVATIFTFFLVSAWHFGLEERDSESAGWLRHLLAIASGGMIIWMPALFRGDEVAELLELITPGDQDSAIAYCVSTVAASAVIFGPLWIFDGIRKDFQSGRPDRSWVRFISSSSCLRMLSIAVLCCFVNPLVSFTLYFCGWHSVRGLLQLARSLGESVLATYRKLLPLSITAFAIVSVGSVAWSSTGEIEASLIRTVFLGLSALAVPHLCLHVVAGSFSQRFTNRSAAYGEVLNHA
jgi:Brp/Blh family beta-carotene 15,15'-monooxygenase